MVRWSNRIFLVWIHVHTPLTMQDPAWYFGMRRKARWQWRGSSKSTGLLLRESEKISRTWRLRAFPPFFLGFSWCILV
jgi:hypothetical protein